MSQSYSPPPAAIQKVPIGQTMRAAYAAVFGSLGLLFKAAVLPFLLSLVVLGLSFMVGESAFLSFVLTVVGFVPYTLFGVAWHRLTLLGPVQGAPLVFPSWHRRHWRFLGYAASVTGIVYLISLPFAVAWSMLSRGEPQGLSMSLIAVVAVAALLLSYVIMRVSFVFPAAAVDEQYSLANAWAHTRGQGFGLLATLFVTALPMLVAIWVISSLLAALVLPDIAAASQETGVNPAEVLRQFIADNVVPFALVQLVLAALNYIVMALMVSAMSVAFRFCTGWVPATPTGPPALGADDGEDS